MQSFRGLVERMFNVLKKWEVLHGGSVESIETKEKEMDVAMALTNLNLRSRLNLLDGIPKRAKFPLGSHIITSDVAPNVPIPKFIKPNDAKFPAHLKPFLADLTNLSPTLRKIVLGVNGFDIFTGRTVQRGENLFLGGNVLHIAVEQEGLDVWRVRFRVGASRKQNVYQCFARINSVNGVLDAACECVAG